MHQHGQRLLHLRLAAGQNEPLGRQMQGIIGIWRHHQFSSCKRCLRKSVKKLAAASSAAALALRAGSDDAYEELLNLQKMRCLILHRLILLNIHQYSQIKNIYF
ncbi:MAG: hypothetical protein RSD99_30990 [Janthinobacterium sp.]